MAVQFEDGWQSIDVSIKRAIDELLEFIEIGRPSTYAPWRDSDKRQMVEILVGAISAGMPRDGSVTCLRAQLAQKDAALAAALPVLEECPDAFACDREMVEQAKSALALVRKEVGDE